MDELKQRLQELLAQESRTKEEKKEVNSISLQIHALKQEAKASSTEEEVDVAV